MGREMFTRPVPRLACRGKRKREQEKREEDQEGCRERVRAQGPA